MKYLLITVIVLAAVGGGMAWWALRGDGAPTIVADQESCTKGAVVTDVDFSMAGQSYLGGKLRSVVSITGFISGKNLYLEAERRDGDGGNLEKRKSLWLDGDFYRRVDDEDWEYIPPERLMLHEPPFPINADIICPNLTHFTFATVEDVDGQGTKKFTAPRLSGEPYDKPLDYGDPGETRDWEIWVDDRGYIVKIAATTYTMPAQEDLPGSANKFQITYSGQGEPNVLPNPKK